VCVCACERERVCVLVLGVCVGGVSVMEPYSYSRGLNYSLGIIKVKVLLSWRHLNLRLGSVWLMSQLSMYSKCVCSCAYLRVCVHRESVRG